jgi:hypothetical protein
MYTLRQLNKAYTAVRITSNWPTRRTPFMRIQHLTPIKCLCTGPDKSDLPMYMILGGSEDSLGRWVDLI